ncbi:hypothetical protein QQ045_018740 [Rhodiola kirilowii]
MSYTSSIIFFFRGSAHGREENSNYALQSTLSLNNGMNNISLVDYSVLWLDFRVENSAKDQGDVAASSGVKKVHKFFLLPSHQNGGLTLTDLKAEIAKILGRRQGGPKIPMKYGRVDVSSHEERPPEGRLPDAGPPSPAVHLRQVFYRMGLSDKDIVALSGAHTLGRSRPERSGWGKPETKYTGVIRS